MVTQNTPRSFFPIVNSMLLLSMLIGCDPRSCQPPPPPADGEPIPTPITATTGASTETIELWLGRRENKPHIDQQLYLGSHVTGFEFSVDITPSLPAGLVVELYDQTDTLVKKLDSSSTLPDTTTFNGNRVRVVVHTNNEWVTLAPQGTKLIISNLSILNSTPAQLTPELALPLKLGVEAMGYTGAGNLLFYIDGLSVNDVHSLYLSPFSPTSTPVHNIHGRLGWKFDKPSQVPTHYEMLEPFHSSTRGTEDVGIYHEMNVDSNRLYLVVDADSGRFFRLTVQRIQSFIGQQNKSVIVELDGVLSGAIAPAVNISSHPGYGVWASPNAELVHNFVRDTSNYNNRGTEILVMGCAGILAATEGFYRFHNIRYNYAIDAFRNADLQFLSDCGRAWAIHGVPEPFAAINNVDLWRQHLQDPARGAAALVHEWGHYQWHLADDYKEHVGTICHNSAMGTDHNTFEFCDNHNHYIGAGANQTGLNSSWSFITALDNIRPPRPHTSATVRYPQNQSNYLDVLHKLESLMDIETDAEPASNSSTFTPCRHIGESCSSSTDCNGYDTSRCDATHNRCIPDDGKGIGTHFCTNDAQCDSRNCNGNACEPTLGLGIDCPDGNNQCRSDSCDSGDGSGQTNKCVPAAGTGQGGEYCSLDVHCESNCCWTNFTPHRCATKRAAGKNCTCGGNNRCQSGKCNADSKCACDDENPCPEGQRCRQGNSTCVTANGSAGMDCTADGQCTNPLACVNGVCNDKQPPGEDCDSHADCMSGTCDFNWPNGAGTLKCVPGPGSGTENVFCVNDGHCNSNFVCSEQKCRKKQELDVPMNELGSESNYRCTRNEQCKSNYCDAANNRCYAAQNEGQPGSFCVNGANCLAGHQCELEESESYGFCN